MSSDETRKDPRKVLAITVRYPSASVDEFVEQHSHDVSRGGMFIKTASPRPVGTLLKFEIKIGGELRVMQGVGRVVWTRPAERATVSEPAGMGVKFIKIDVETKAVIDRLAAARGDVEGRYDVGTAALARAATMMLEPGETGETPSVPPPAAAAVKPVRKATMLGLGEDGGDPMAAAAQQALAAAGLATATRDTSAISESSKEKPNEPEETVLALLDEALREAKAESVKLAADSDVRPSQALDEGPNGAFGPLGGSERPLGRTPASATQPAQPTPGLKLPSVPVPAPVISERPSALRSEPPAAPAPKKSGGAKVVLLLILIVIVAGLVWFFTSEAQPQPGSGLAPETNPSGLAAAPSPEPAPSVAPAAAPAPADAPAPEAAPAAKAAPATTTARGTTEAPRVDNAARLGAGDAALPAGGAKEPRPAATPERVRDTKSAARKPTPRAAAKPEKAPEAGASTPAAPPAQKPAAPAASGSDSDNPY